MRTTVTYLFDPLCGWCYGTSPTIQKLGWHQDIRLELAPTGLFAGGGRRMNAVLAEFAWSNDQRIAKLTGQPFTEAYLKNVLGQHGGLFDSAVMTLALTAVSLTEPQRELDVLNALQEARYVQGLDTTNAQVVCMLLRGLGLDAAAERLAASDPALIDHNAARLRMARSLMQTQGAHGVPALVVRGASADRLLGGNALYGNFEQLLGQILANAKSDG
jgi:putative protein-disulfide isomerase